MKKIFLMITVALSLYATVDDKERLIKEYQEMFQKISQKRVGLSDDQIVKVTPPFVKVLKKTGTKSAVQNKQKAAPLVLEAILGNRVLINGKWYKLYQKVGSLQIVSISGDNVYLKGQGTKQKLTIRKKNANITIK